MIHSGTRLTALLFAALLAGACSGSQPRPGTTSSGAEARLAKPPALRVEVVANGLENAWDAGVLPDGKVLVTQRAGRLTLLSGGRPGASVTELNADLSDVYATGEGGLMGLVIHPDFARSREFTTCQTYARDGSPVDVRLVTWRLSADEQSAQRVADPLVSGLPINPSGRHSGCQPALGPDGELLVGTGDSADPAAAQDRHGLGGKLLRMDLKTGKPLPDNPFASSSNPDERLIDTYGHRNVQGVAVQPGTGEIYTAEHGPDIDDEVNRTVPGANYGWDPSRGGAVTDYNEDVPMTDLGRFPNAVRAVWSTGDETEAVSGSAFVTGKAWGAWDGALAISALKGSKLLLLRLTKSGTLRDVSVPAELNQSYGRLRAAVRAPDGALYVTTSNGEDDKLLRVTPK
jgi:glucose/arabinose dehydrogenase